MTTADITEYTVYPTGYDDFVNSDRSMWALRVKRVSRDRNLWMIEATAGSALDVNGMLDYIPPNSLRSKMWERTHWFPFSVALARARGSVDSLMLNYRTAQQASDFVAARIADRDGGVS